MKDHSNNQMVDDKTINRYEKFSIELDCPPGNPRPNDLIGTVVHGTGIEVEDFDTANPFFGHQVWILKSEVNKDETFTNNKPLFKARISQLFNDGLIRYGTW